MTDIILNDESYDEEDYPIDPDLFHQLYNIGIDITDTELLEYIETLLDECKGTAEILYKEGRYDMLYHLYKYKTWF